MESKTILPLIDKILLSMGALLAIMVHMELVSALPVEVARVQPGAAEQERGDFRILTLAEDAIELDGEPVEYERLPHLVAGERLVLRAHRELSTERTLRVLADLIEWGADVSIQVSDQPDDPRR